jgi:coenzyme PQQ synthesis protein D (PqqD)
VDATGLRAGSLYAEADFMNENRETFRRRPGIEVRTIERAAVLVESEQHLYFALNRVGARIWSLLEQPRTVAEMTAILAGEFTVDEAECRRHTEQFLRLLIEKKLAARLP